jgi:heterodisulfide reductase subunit B
MSLIAPLRILAKAQKEGDRILVPCSICYNTLKRANFIFSEDKEAVDIINEHLEENYDGKEKVIHPLEFFRDNQDLIKKHIKKPLTGLKVGCYYGCLLLRPAEEIKFDDPESPSIFEDYVRLLGAEPVEFPFRVECCGSYLVVNTPDAAVHASYNVIKNARDNGADALITTCPLCFYNLDALQTKMKQHLDFKEMPIFYFSQLLALALGIDEDGLQLGQNRVPPQAVLKKYGLL